MKEKLIVTLSLSDMFATNKNNFSINQGSVNASGFRQSDTRRFGLNLRYSFGVRKKEENNNIFNKDLSGKYSVWQCLPDFRPQQRRPL